jgi:EAL domain-containing protein (putative c-di-GMP-specific phosphodiesterase class I)
MDISSLLRRQPVCAIRDDDEVRPVFNELFVSIGDLQRTVMPTVNLAASAPLFSYLTQYLDHRILRVLPEIEPAIPLSTSININVETVLSPQFLEFDQKLRAVSRKTIILEFQPSDLFTDFAGFAFARDFVRNRGYRICLDGLTPHTLGLVDKKMLRLDLQKLVWSPEGWETGASGREQMVETIRRVGPTRIVLCRCDDQRAVDFGRSLGISLFQGRHVDAQLYEQTRNARVA